MCVQVRFVGTASGEVLAPEQLFDPRSTDLAALLDGATLFPGAAFASRPEVQRHPTIIYPLKACIKTHTYEHPTYARLPHIHTSRP